MFKNMFIGKQTQASKFKKMSERIQGSGESVYAYAFDKYRLCKEAQMDFEETKDELLIGLRSKDLSQYLASATHVDFDALIEDIRKFERRNQRRSANFAMGSKSANVEEKKVTSKSEIVSDHKETSVT